MRRMSARAGNLTDDDLQDLGFLAGRRKKKYERRWIKTATSLLQGTRGSGKTFLLRCLHNDFQVESLHRLPVKVDLANSMVFLHNAPEVVSGYVLLSLCVELWKSVFGNSYADLMDMTALQNRKVSDDFKPNQKRFAEIYAALHARQFEYNRVTRTAFGASAGAKAEIGGERSAKMTRGGLLPFEFKEILQEILHICENKRPIRPVILCDEANLFNIDQQVDLVTGCLDIFNAHGIQFVWSLAKFDWLHQSLIPEAFEVVVELEGLQTAAEAGELIQRHFPEILDLSQEALEIVYEFHRGHPRMTLGACEFLLRGFDLDSDTVPVRISPQQMTRACLGHRDELVMWAERESQLNPRR